ncbi:unnamed protein product [Acanthoscelides obtectus]|uniref:Reverse transcriptase domain-containing protein n=1 Tax=Acanthoscelides obtectus TaxID=200917 RepID=A0A9P0QA12_ACAOB|nr:unnamed protein product [Acanthoscelides obtectus]CAK1627008.1 Protein P [Acanthoscelides obtectus]
MVKLDLSQAYFHIPVKKSHQRYLALSFQGKVYTMTCLPFGLATAPLTFARVSNWIASQLRKKNVRIIVYLDDFLIAGQTVEEVRHDMHLAVAFLRNLGWKINYSKSILEPTRVIEFLGLGWDTGRNRKFVPQRKVDRIRKELRKRIDSGLWNWRQAKSILGKLNFVGCAIPLGRLHCRRIQIASKRLPEFEPKTSYRIPQEVIQQLHWWLENLEQTSELFTPPITVFLSTDASDVGWGAHLLDKTIKGTWTGQTNVMAHKQKGVVCRFPCIEEVQGDSEAQNRIDTVRQPDGCCLYKKRGRHQIQNPSQNDGTATVVCKELPDPDISKVHPGGLQQYCRSPVSAEGGARLAPVRDCHSSNFSQMGPTNNRSVCNQEVESRSCLCEPVSGGHGRPFHRCVQSPMELRNCLGISPSIINSKDAPSPQFSGGDLYCDRPTMGAGILAARLTQESA